MFGNTRGNDMNDQVEVLLADQDLALAKLYPRFLRVHGLAAETAASARECRRKLVPSDWDVLVLDRELPGRSANRLLSQIRADGISTAVVLTTSTASPDADGRLVVPPVVLCLRKFFPLPELAEAVRSAATPSHFQPSVLAGI
jgi:DNA-binding response OmpR family regulator